MKENGGKLVQVDLRGVVCQKIQIQHLLLKKEAKKKKKNASQETSYK